MAGQNRFVIVGAGGMVGGYTSLRARQLRGEKGYITKIENGLKKTFGYDRINYFMLMMVDFHVHFTCSLGINRHVLLLAVNGSTGVGPSHPKSETKLHRT
jgi:hypothetical protein